MMYQLPNIKTTYLKKQLVKASKNTTLRGMVCLAVGLTIAASLAGTYAQDYVPAQLQPFFESLKFPRPTQPPAEQPQPSAEYHSAIGYEQAIIDAAKQNSPSVVSIVISKNVPVYEQQFVNPFGENSPFDFQVPQMVQKGTQLQQIGAGSGFVVSADGLVLTNKHVVSDKTAQYTVYTNEGKKYPAKVMALDPVQDLAVIKVESDAAFTPVKLGDSSGIQIGQTAIAIGNALGQFSNTVSVGIVSGLSRTISASDQLGGGSETLEGIIQTDAAINAGNSGGPLVNLKGEVIGINTAMAQGAQSIGFAIPINLAKKDIQQVSQNSKITYPFLGIRYVLIDDEVKAQYKLSVDSGAYIVRGKNGEPAVTKDSGAQKAGVKEKDIILEANGEKITKTNSLASIIMKYNPGDTVTLKVLRAGAEMEIPVTLGERSN